jgi:hypothetical protein
MNILQAIDDPQIFAPWFKRRGDWLSWRAWLAASFGLPMTAQMLEVYRRCTGREVPPSSPVSECWMICGRRSGKSFHMALTATFLACFGEYRRYLAPGERGTVLILATDKRQARTVVRYIRGLITGVPMLAQLIERDTAAGFDLVNRVTIEVGAASMKTTRGYTIVSCLCDEIAFWPTGDEAAEPDYSVLDAIRPAMATIPSAKLLCASSPYARRGALHDAFRRYFGKDGPVLVWKADTRTMNPTVSQRTIDEAYERDNASASSEFGAEFRDDIAGYIGRALIESAVDVGVTVRPPQAGRRYVSWIDASSGASDSFACGIGSAHGRDLLMLDCLVEVRAPFNTASATAQVAEVLKSYGLNETMGDDFAKGWVVSELARHGVRFQSRPSEMTRSALYLETISLFSAGRVRLLDNKRLVSQYAALERRVMPGGRDAVDHPNRSGHHDDLSNVCAGVLWRLQAGAAPFVVTNDLLARAMAMPVARGRECTAWGFNKRAALAHMLIPREKQCYPRSALPAERFHQPTSEEGD